jgi:hypothetical protein
VFLILLFISIYYIFKLNNCNDKFVQLHSILVKNNKETLELNKKVNHLKNIENECKIKDLQNIHNVKESFLGGDSSTWSPPHKLGGDPSTWSPPSNNEQGGNNSNNCAIKKDGIVDNKHSPNYPYNGHNNTPSSPTTPQPNINSQEPIIQSYQPMKCVPKPKKNKCHPCPSCPPPPKCNPCPSCPPKQKCPSYPKCPTYPNIQCPSCPTMPKCPKCPEYPKQECEDCTQEECDCCPEIVCPPCPKIATVQFKDEIQRENGMCLSRLNKPSVCHDESDEVNEECKKKILNGDSLNQEDIDRLVKYGNPKEFSINPVQYTNLRNPIILNKCMYNQNTQAPTQMPQTQRPIQTMPPNTNSPYSIVIDDDDSSKGGYPDPNAKSKMYPICFGNNCPTITPSEEHSTQQPHTLIPSFNRHGERCIRKDGRIMKCKLGTKRCQPLGTKLRQCTIEDDLIYMKEYLGRQK